MRPSDGGEKQGYLDAPTGLAALNRDKQLQVTRRYTRTKGWSEFNFGLPGGKEKRQVMESVCSGRDCFQMLLSQQRLVL